MSYCVYDIKLADVTSIEDLRIIRNECRLYMTNNTNIISESDQIEWFKTLNTNVKPYVFYMNNDPIGYHHFAGSHRNKETVINVLKKYRDEYNDKNV